MPAQNEQERLIMRRAQDLLRIADTRGFAQYSSFLSTREQSLSQMALNKLDARQATFCGGYPDAERKLLCIQPAGADSEPPISCIKLECSVATEKNAPEHRDYLGALLALGIQRKCLGDIILDTQIVGTAYVFVLDQVASLICTQLSGIGRLSVQAALHMGELPCAAQEHPMQTATVSSLRADAVLAAMLRCSRGQAGDILRMGRLEINHMVITSTHAPVYEGDIFTVRGKGRFQLKALGGKSKKDRLFIEYFQY